ncbi:pyruvate kinase [Mycolicibacterium hippocampi]|nr:pyruvate kinase [Mycolicibacterium hippocampi]
MPSDEASSGGTLDALARDVDQLRRELDGAQQQWSPWIGRVAPQRRSSAVNMAHYWAIRQHDLRDLQTRLAEVGLSSLGRSEPHVQRTLDLVAGALCALRGRRQPAFADNAIGVREGYDILQQRTEELLGPRPGRRSVRIMVTLPTEAAKDERLVSEMVAHGMDVARINCAHDGPDDWRAMAANVRSAAREHGRACRVAMDLAGPKLRTGALQPEDAHLMLGAGDLLRLTRDAEPATADSHRIGCSLPQVFDHAEPGHRIYFDDGKLGGVVVSVDSEGLDVRIDHPARDKAKLKPGKGVNVPDTDLHISAITDKDLDDLSTVVDIADVVEVSFVRDPEDVQRLLDELDRRNASELGVVAKIETKPAFEKLPQILMTLMQRSRAGVMIARGDLAVEVGYERMAELQEEMLWLCESAHLPVLWATQVLETLAKKGQPTRAEVSDAAMGVRAECVMLNKGPYITDAVSTLDSILCRMEKHRYKKNPLLRTLTSWRPDAAEFIGT